MATLKVVPTKCGRGNRDISTQQLSESATDGQPQPGSAKLARNRIVCL